MCEPVLDRIRADFEADSLHLRIRSGVYIKQLADEGIIEIGSRPIEECMKEWSALVNSLPEDEVRKHLNV